MSFYLSPRVDLSVKWDEASVDLVKLGVLGRVSGNPGAQLDRFLKVFLTVVPVRIFLPEYPGMIIVQFFVDFFHYKDSFLGQRVPQLRHIKYINVAPYQPVSTLTKKNLYKKRVVEFLIISYEDFESVEKWWREWSYLVVMAFAKNPRTSESATAFILAAEGWLLPWLLSSLMSSIRW